MDEKQTEQGVPVEKTPVEEQRSLFGVLVTDANQVAVGAASAATIYASKKIWDKFHDQGSDDRGSDAATPRDDKGGESGPP